MISNSDSYICLGSSTINTGILYKSGSNPVDDGVNVSLCNKDD